MRRRNQVRGATGVCGICGFVGPSDPDVLADMRDALASRGPDGAGAYGDGEVALGHRRLAIVDLATGDQPTFNEDRSVVVVFNGEIYNHPELRPQLEAAGHRYATRSDTETIVHAYEEYGVECVRHLDGMFAFVLYDRRNRLLFGARDRLGEKPLYLTVRPFGPVAFAFASELKALRRHPEVGGRLELAREGLVSYLVNDYVAGPGSIVEGVERLEPGGAFTFGLPGSEREGLRRWRYWEPTPTPEAVEAGRAIGEEEAAGRLRELLGEAVRSRLMADVPLGAFLSGGIDSSSVVAFLTRFRPAREVKTFSIGFDEPSFDESSHAEAVAQRFGTDHHHRVFSAADLLAEWPRVAAYLDEPFADPSVLPVAMLCGFARQHVTVALGGDGGDELFAGYDPFRALAPARAYAALMPDLIHRRVVVPMSGLLPASSANMSLGFKVGRFLRGARVDPSHRVATWMGAFSLPQLRRLAPGLGDLLEPERAYGPIIEAHRRAVAAGADSLGQAIDFFQRFYLPDDILVKVDRASMMHSLEVRSPFLAPELVEFVNALPGRLKLRRGRTKWLLKRALEGDGRASGPLPRSIVHRPKKGFGIPAARWLRHELRAPARALLLDPWPAPLAALFDRREVERLHAQHVEGRANHYKELWALLMLVLWAREHLAPGAARPGRPVAQARR